MLSIIYNKLISKKATTLTELIIYSAILGIVVMAVIMFFTRSNISIQKSQLKVEAQEDVRVVLIEMEMDLGEANQIIASSSTAIPVGNLRRPKPKVLSKLPSRLEYTFTMLALLSVT